MPRNEEECRAFARECFSLAIAEDDLDRREALLVEGEEWMLKARLWFA